MLGAIFTIFIFQLAGEAFQKYFDLAIPGPVIGLILMLLSLLLTKQNINPNVTTFRTNIINTSENLLKYLSLLFVPIGVGVIMHLQLLEAQLLRIIAVIVLGTIFTMIFTSVIFLKTSKAKADE
ncbi:MAG: CidA/LrgA family protein [Candidatus Puniceispirillum sp.]|uniref:CidA/LrgA family protein n=1 Tax=uncultured Candidatus Puniceispirillum sp. TaxID=1985115 RepID=UPI002A6F379E|nr:CidA/LrgA family protein [Candidatus Puniceispirillum sp.]